MVEKMARVDKGSRKLLAWQQTHQLALLVYKQTEKFPKQEMFGLTSQIHRAAVSASANVAEGYAPGGRVNLTDSWAEWSMISSSLPI